MDGDGVSYQHILLQNNPPTNTIWDTRSIFETNEDKTNDDDTDLIVKGYTCCIETDKPVIVPLLASPPSKEVYTETLVQNVRPDCDDSVPLLHTDLSFKDQSELDIRLSHYLTNDEDSGILETIEDDISSIDPVDIAVLQRVARKGMDSSPCGECNTLDDELMFVQLEEDPDISTNADFEWNEDGLYPEVMNLLDKEPASCEEFVPIFASFEVREIVQSDRSCEMDEKKDCDQSIESTAQSCTENNEEISKTTENQPKIPLLRPPPMEKLKKWQEVTTCYSTESHSSAVDRIKQLERLMQTWNPNFKDNNSGHREKFDQQTINSFDDSSREKAKLKWHARKEEEFQHFDEEIPITLSKSNSIVDPILAEKITLASAKVSDKFEQEYKEQEQDDSMICMIKDGLLDVCNSALENDQDCQEECFDSCIVPKITEDKPKRRRRRRIHYNYHTPPTTSPSPFELTLATYPNVIKILLSYLGNPQTVCILKCVNKHCYEYIKVNEHVLMRDAVRAGGLKREIRPKFWLWILLERCNTLKNENDVISEEEEEQLDTRPSLHPPPIDDFLLLENIGKFGEWNNLILRDVARAFGNLPPHKTGATCTQNSIVPALIYRPPTLQRKEKKQTESSIEGTDSTLHDCSYEEEEITSSTDLTLSGYNLTPAAKLKMQNILERILNAMSAAYPQVGYCQGMDYVVSFLLRVLKDTIQNKCGSWPIKNKKCTEECFCVDEAVFWCMDTFFSVYNLRHMYWPELRCLKMCTRIFEKLIKLKLPVLADHFDHHDLNIGMFALGWFQTLFLYLPAMPSSTVCQIWDIWLVERSFKIFFRVGVAILFLSQPILLNHEMEGMMNYLNTFGSDVTLFNADILIPCALQFKITNEMIVRLEQECLDEFF